MACNAAFFGDRIRCMGKKPMTVTEMASMGGRTRAQKYSKAELREFAKGAGRPVKLDGRARRRLRQLLTVGKESCRVRRRIGRFAQSGAGKPRATPWNAYCRLIFTLR